MRRATAAFVAAVALALAGCIAQSTEDGSGILGPPGEPGPPPVTSKLAFESAAPPAGALVPVLEQEPQPSGTVELPRAMFVQLAFDFAGGGDPLDFYLEAPDGQDLLRQSIEEGGKRVAKMQSFEPGTYRVFAQSPSPWTVLLVLTVFPQGFEEGNPLFVSSPGATQVEHRFYPNRIEVPAGGPSRITLYDFDPHAGTSNLQHNLFFPELGLRTEGKTTWGEVRVLDLPALAAGAYAYECEFHGFGGQLVVGG